MDKNKKRLLILFGAVVLVGLIMIALVLGWFSRRGKAFDSRPLVLIHEPGYDDLFHVGDGVIIHATATEDNGLTRIELWVNDILVDALDSEGPDIKDLTLFSSWVPSYEGEQQIIVRAISSDDVSGQSSIRITVIDDEESVMTHIVEEGETLESIAEDYGTSPEELDELNSGLGSEGPAPGDGLIVPDEEPPSEEPSSEELPPEPEEEREAPMFDGGPTLMDSVFSLSDVIPSRELPIALRLEIPRLQTINPFDELHCYVGLADSLPQWYPDRDHNQATDETFAALGDGLWNTAEILTGDNAPLIIWPPDRPLPATINCVGVTGGTEAIELSRLDLEIQPYQWNGIRHTYEVDGEGGHLELDVRVSKYHSGSRITPKTPDPDMEVPFNQGLDREARTFSWDYSDEGEELILGFEVFLNDNLLWTEGPSNRESRMPSEWFRPPCGTTYTFGVRAYRYDNEDDTFYESDMAEISIRPPGDSCVRNLQITFLSLETFDLGDDGDHEDRRGDVGPAYGSFFANRRRFSFDQGPESRGSDMPDGLSHHTLYDLSVVAADPDWDATGPNVVYVDLPEGRTLRVGFLIMDRDNNPDDRVCRGTHLPLNDELVNFDEVFTSTIISDNRQCEVRFEIRPGPTSPVGVAGDGGEPLPWLDWVGHSINDSNGTFSLDIMNTGTAGWAEHNLNIGIYTREGDFIREVSIVDLDIPVGETVSVSQDDMNLPSPPYDFCLHLDHYDQVLELHERTGNLTHVVECPEVPDLEVLDANFQEHLDSQIQVHVRNIGSVDIENRSLTMEVRRMSDNTRLFDPIVTTINIGSGESRILNIPVPAGFRREEMADGYLVNINPGNGIAESTYTNNYFEVGEATRLSAFVSVVRIPAYLQDDIDYHVDGYIRQGRLRKEQVFNFDVSGTDVDWDCDPVLDCFEAFRHGEYWEDWFEIYGDEDLEVVINFDIPGFGGEDLAARAIYEPPSWNAGHFDLAGGSCHHDFERIIGHNSFRVIDVDGDEWSLDLDLCRENYGEE